MRRFCAQRKIKSYATSSCDAMGGFALTRIRASWAPAIFTWEAMVSGTKIVIRQIEDLFGDIYAADEVAVWLNTPQAMLSGAKPMALIESGQGDRVVDAVHEILDGITI